MWVEEQGSASNDIIIYVFLGDNKTRLRDEEWAEEAMNCSRGMTFSSNRFMRFIWIFGKNNYLQEEVVEEFINNNIRMSYRLDIGE